MPKPLRMVNAMLLNNPTQWMILALVFAVKSKHVMQTLKVSLGGTPSLRIKFYTLQSCFVDLSFNLGTWIW